MRANVINRLIDPPEHVPVTFVCGDAGMGKTTLIREVEQQVNSSLAERCIITDCSSPVGGIEVGSVEALHPWIAAMKELTSLQQNTGHQKLAADLAMAWIKFVPIVGDLIESTVSTVGIVKKHKESKAEVPTSRDHVFQQCISFFNEVSSKQKLVVIIDDAHWADDSSVNLLFALARFGSSNVRYIVTYRPYDVMSARDGAEHPLAHVVRELTRYSLCETMDLAPLDDVELRQMLTSRNKYVDDSTVDTVKNFSGGNPLLALGWMEGGRQAASVDAVIAERLHRIDNNLRELLILAAAEGEIFSSNIIRKLSPLEPLLIATLLRKAESEHGLIYSRGKKQLYASESSVYQFSNQAVHSALETMLGAEESELVHGAIADILMDERATLEITDVSWMTVSTRLAVHFDLSNRRVEAAATYLEIASRAWQLYAESEAMKAIINLYRVSDSTPVKNETLKRVVLNAIDLESRIHQFAHRVAEADDASVRLKNAAVEIGDSKIAATATVRRAQIANLSGRPHDVHMYAEQALEEARKIGYTDAQRGAISMLGMWHEAHGRLDEAEACFRSTLDLTVLEKSNRYHATSLVNIGRILLHRGQHQNALDCFQQAADLLESESDWDGLARALNNIGICLVELGRLTDAEKTYTRALEMNEKIGNRIGASSLRTNLGQLLLRENRIDEALVLFETSIAVKRDVGDPYGLAIALYSKGLALSEKGHTKSAMEVLDQAMQSAMEAGEQLVIDEIKKINRGLGE